MPTGYEQIYNSLLPRLAECNIVRQAKHLGLQPEGDAGASVEFLGRKYLITNDGVDVTDAGPPVQINNRSLLIYYILSEGHVEPRFSFVQLNRLTGMIDGRNAQEGWFINNDLLRETEGKYTAFAAAAHEMGGTCIGQVGGGQCWQFVVLPKMPIRLIFFEADAEFPAELQFQFDETAPYYMGFECLAFLSGSVLHELCRIVKKQKEE